MVIMLLPGSAISRNEVHCFLGNQGTT